MCEDLSSFELDQIDRVESKYHEISKKNSEKLFEEKFKEVALAITQLYTSVGKFYNYKRPFWRFLVKNQHKKCEFFVKNLKFPDQNCQFSVDFDIRLIVSGEIGLFDRTFLITNCKTEKETTVGQKHIRHSIMQRVN